MLEEGIKDVPVGRGIRWRRGSEVGDLRRRGIDELTCAIGGDIGGRHVGLQPMNNPPRSRVRWVSGIGVNHE